MAEQPIYLDNHATTRTDPRVLEAMLPYFCEKYGNAGSVVHSWGEEAREAVESAADSIARHLGATREEIVFTSGATESNNLAIHGVVERNSRRGNHLVSVATEHRAVLEPLERLRQRGCNVTRLDVAEHGTANAGWLDPAAVADVLQDDTVLVSVMLANNEIGVIHPLSEIAAVCRHRGVLLHCDATQGVGKIPVDVRELGVDLLSFSAHKIYGPQGVGGLYIRSGHPFVRLTPQISGGGQQDGRRAGTLNVPGIVGMAKALELCTEELATEQPRQATLRNRLYVAIAGELPDVQLCGPDLEAADSGGNPLRLAGNLDLALGDVDGEALLLEMRSLAVSSGATCSSHEPGPSHVLTALGMAEDLARSTLRFGLSRFTTEEEIDRAAGIVVQAVRKLRQFSST